MLNLDDVQALKKGDKLYSARTYRYQMTATVQSVVVRPDGTWYIAIDTGRTWASLSPYDARYWSPTRVRAVMERIDHA